MPLSNAERFDLDRKIAWLWRALACALAAGASALGFVYRSVPDRGQPWPGEFRHPSPSPAAAEVSAVELDGAMTDEVWARFGGARQVDHGLFEAEVSRVRLEAIQALVFDPECRRSLSAFRARLAAGRPR